MVLAYSVSIVLELFLSHCLNKFIIHRDTETAHYVSTIGYCKVPCHIFCGMSCEVHPCTMYRTGYVHKTVLI